MEQLSVDPAKESFRKKYFKGLKTHKVELSGAGDKTEYDVALHPLDGTEHRYTLILLHGIGYTAYGFYKWVSQNSKDLFFGDPDNFDEASGSYDLLKHCRIVIPTAQQ